MESGFEQVFLMLNSLNRDVGDVFDTYVYAVGLTGGQYSYSAAVGLFKSVVSLVLVIAANRFAKRLGQEGVY
jgi:putative aldouronate transport system permease protein